MTHRDLARCYRRVFMFLKKLSWGADYPRAKVALADMLLETVLKHPQPRSSVILAVFRLSSTLMELKSSGSQCGLAQS